MTKLVHKLYIFTLIAITVTVFSLLFVYGLNYYSTPITERHFHAQNDLLKPTGLIGHGIGIAGSLLMIIGVFGYMARKRFRSLSRIGALKYFLEFHIFLCTLGPILVLYHTTFKFGGIVAVSFWSMVAVVLSGIIGRFIYLQIPRTIQGRELSLSDLAGAEDELYAELQDNYKVNYEIIAQINIALSDSESKQTGNFILRIINRFSFERKLLKQVRKELKTQQLNGKDYRKVVKLFKSKIILNRRIAWLSTMQNFLRYWHVAHLPFALIMLVIMIVHIIVAVLFGYKWIF
ncbi:MAG: hypothetical protein IPF54_08990 [Draconibacterium sp.]|nr:hypothetical protein [Draconibacterium sp.]